VGNRWVPALLTRVQRRWSAYIGYLYTNRTIAQYSDTNDTELIYFPDGVTTSPANDFLAARGSCAEIAGALPAGCTLNADGSVTYIPPPSPASVRSLTTINENALLLGGVVRPVDTLRITADLQFGYNDNSYTRIDPRQVQSYNIHANYKPRPWATVEGAVEIHENRDNVFTVNNLEHDRSYSFATILMASPRLSVDFKPRATPYHPACVYFPSRCADVADRTGVPDCECLFAPGNAFDV
jgi:hypothetical protein